MAEFDKSLLHLEMIVETITKIQKHIAKLDDAYFVEDAEAIDVFAFRLSQIGEAAGKLPAGLKARNADIPWKEVVGLRNLIVHEYRRVIPLRLWETASNGLAPLLDVCMTELQRLEGNS